MDQLLEILPKILGVYCLSEKCILIYGGGDIGLRGSVSQAVNTGESHVLGIIFKILTRETTEKTNREELIVIGA